MVDHLLSEAACPGCGTEEKHESALAETERVHGEGEAEGCREGAGCCPVGLQGHRRGRIDAAIGIPPLQVQCEEGRPTHASAPYALEGLAPGEARAVDARVGVDAAGQRRCSGACRLLPRRHCTDHQAGSQETTSLLKMGNVFGHTALGKASCGNVRGRTTVPHQVPRVWVPNLLVATTWSECRTPHAGTCTLCICRGRE